MKQWRDKAIRKKMGIAWNYRLSFSNKFSVKRRGLEDANSIFYSSNFKHILSVKTFPCEPSFCSTRSPLKRFKLTSLRQVMKAYSDVAPKRLLNHMLKVLHDSFRDSWWIRQISSKGIRCRAKIGKFFFFVKKALALVFCQLNCYKAAYEVNRLIVNKL